MASLDNSWNTTDCLEKEASRQQICPQDSDDVDGTGNGGDDSSNNSGINRDGASDGEDKGGGDEDDNDSNNRDAQRDMRMA